MGCSSGGPEDATQVELAFKPSPPVIGQTRVTAKLATRDGKPIAGAKVRLEGNMNHAGMKPSFADMKESGPGVYEGDLEFTMGGDWFILVDATTADGKKIERKIDVRGVKKP